MTNVLLAIALLLLIANLALLILLLRRKVAIDLTPVQQSFDGMQKAHERTERAVRDEIFKNREDADGHRWTYFRSRTSCVGRP